MSCYGYRVLRPDERHQCYVGSGECKLNATHATDTGQGTGEECFMCAFHREEMEWWEKKFENLPSHLFEQLEAHVRDALKKQQSQ